MKVSIRVIVVLILLLVFAWLTIYTLQPQHLAGKVITMMIFDPAILQIEGENVRLQAQSNAAFSLDGPQYISAKQQTLGLDAIYFLDIPKADGVWSLEQERGVRIRITSNKTIRVVLREGNSNALLVVVAVSAALLVILAIVEWFERRSKKKLLQNQKAAEVEWPDAGQQ